MEITISVSEKTARIIQHQAEETGKNISDFARDLLEEKLAEAIENTPRKKKLSDLAGIFYGGDGKTAANAKEILRSEIDKTSGFGK